jgi:hypothetical protein
LGYDFGLSANLRLEAEMSDDETLAHLLVRVLETTRRAERDLFGALPPEIRDRPLASDWSPKDHQAHLTAWKARQADRYQAVQVGEELADIGEGEETDAMNAQLHATRADWTWAAVEQEADRVFQRLADLILATDPATLLGSERLVAGTFGNGTNHAGQHFVWLLEADIGFDRERVLAFTDEVERLIRASILPEPHRSDGLYNLACFHALLGRGDAARSILRDALRDRPDLVDWAREDSDLVDLRDEIPGLAAQVEAGEDARAVRR